MEKSKGDVIALEMSPVEPHTRPPTEDPTLMPEAPALLDRIGGVVRFNTTMSFLSRHSQTAHDARQAGVVADTSEKKES